MFPRISPLILLAALFTASRAALADDTATALADRLSQSDTSNVVLASVLGDQQDPFASSPAIETPSQWTNEPANNGGANLSIDFAYANKYFYRGVNHDAVASHGNSLNLLFDGRLEFNLGQYPHPFVELFTNIYDADPLSRFQEIRPIAGADWDVKPFDFQLSEVSYIYPERENYNYPEIDIKITLDDYLLLNTDKPVLSPYILGAFEYQKNEGWYVEFGFRHDFVFEDLGLTVSPQLAVAWISGLRQQFVFINNVRNTGWQHLEVGGTLSYSLNHLLDVSKKFGEFDVKAFGYYDEHLNSRITASNGFWGGIGLGFKY